MSTEEAQTDLSLRDEDAENIVGGKSAKAVHKTAKPVAGSVAGGSTTASSTEEAPGIRGEDEVDIEC
jgi:hypothetical protein